MMTQTAPFTNVVKVQMMPLPVQRHRLNGKPAASRMPAKTAATPPAPRIVPIPAPGLTVWEG
jgi:hypothetical protein